MRWWCRLVLLVVGPLRGWETLVEGISFGAVLVFAAVVESAGFVAESCRVSLEGRSEGLVGLAGLVAGSYLGFHGMIGAPLEWVAE